MGESDILPPSEIEAILRDYQARVGQVPLNATERNVGRLLSHLRALVAPADGEALGCNIVAAIVEDISDRRGLRHEWNQIDEEIRAEIKHTWAGIVDSGVAAVALSREGEIAQLQAIIEGDGEGYRELLAKRDAEIARLTAELAEVRKEATAVRDDVVHSMTREADARVAAARADGAREERVKSSALIATLRELLEEREWDFEDNGRESNSCRTCGVTLRHGDPMKHKPGCALDAALRGDR